MPGREGKEAGTGQLVLGQAGGENAETTGQELLLVAFKDTLFPNRSAVVRPLSRSLGLPE